MRMDSDQYSNRPPAGNCHSGVLGVALATVLLAGTFPIDLSAQGADTDGDSMPDAWELSFGLNPNNPADAALDPDGDGLTNVEEFQNQTRPDRPDTDFDWIPDGFEVNTAGTNPNDSDTDGDLMQDFYELIYGLNPNDAADADGDLDSDGFTNFFENRLNSRPDSSSSVPEELGYYYESFESPNLSNAWYTPGDSEEDWNMTCGSFSGYDGSCSRQAGYLNGSNDISRLNLLVNVEASTLSFRAAYFTDGLFRVFIDDVLVLERTGWGVWLPFEYELAEGPHEISFLHERSAGSQGTLVVDALEITNGYAVGLPVRPTNELCTAPPIGGSEAAIDIEYLYPEAVFELPTKLLQPENDGSRWYVLQKEGLLRVFDVADPENVRTWLDFSDNLRTDAEAGLLGMAFHPNFPDTPEIFVAYVSEASYTTISRIILDDTDTPVSPIEEPLILLYQGNSYHQGGDIAFGPDNYLYIGLGEDHHEERAPDTTNLYGSMLRIDVVDVPWPVPRYEIPPGNAFPATNNYCGPGLSNPNDCPEIFAWGFRNPWRWNFDRTTGSLWLGDVGENNWEEVDLVVANGNYGWGCREGRHPGPLTEDCDGPFIDPVAEYAHDPFGNTAVVAGFVYRGDAIPELQGRFLYTDVASGRIWALRSDGTGGYEADELFIGPQTVTNYGLGADDEIYFVDYITGRMGMIVPSADAPEPVIEIPDDLVDTGCVMPVDPTQPAPGLIPYAIQAPFWSDNAVKDRFMALPNGTTVTIDGDGDWQYPIGTVLLKNFRLNGQLIETRAMMHRPDGDEGVWEGHTWAWDDTETVATRVVGGATRMVGGQQWIYPSEAQCMQCHTAAHQFTLGPETPQLNRSITYPSTGITANQLDTLDAIGMLTVPLGVLSDQLPQLPDPFDTSFDLAERARAYLHTNCSQCHRPGTVVPSSMDLRYTTTFSDTATCDVIPGAGSLGIGPTARLISPGDADSSVLVGRMSRRDAFGMPPVGSDIPDVAGATLLTEWINSLTGCQ